jgi:hypothetical protein
MDIICRCPYYNQTRLWCERCNTCEGLHYKILKTAYCAHEIKYILVMEDGAERGKYLTINRIKNSI